MVFHASTRLSVHNTLNYSCTILLPHLLYNFMLLWIYFNQLQLKHMMALLHRFESKLQQVLTKPLFAAKAGRIAGTTVTRGGSSATASGAPQFVTKLSDVSARQVSSTQLLQHFFDLEPGNSRPGSRQILTGRFSVRVTRSNSRLRSPAIRCLRWSGPTMEDRWLRARRAR